MTPASKAAILYAYACGYRVKDNGDLISPRGKKMRATPTGVGYPSFKVGQHGKHGKQRTILLHVYAAYCWYGKAVFDVECVRHKDDVRANCTRKNILLGTRRDNRMDMPRHERLRIGRNAVHSRHARTAEVRQKRNAYILVRDCAGDLHRVIARTVGLSRAQVSKLVRTMRKP